MDNLAELLPLISKLSENPQAMSAISGLMGAMGSTKTASQNNSSPQNNDTVSAIMSMLGGAPSKKEDDHAPPDFKQGNAQTFSIGKIFGSQEEIKNRIILLNAVRPYLSEARREKLEAVIKLMRLAEIGTLGSLLK